MRGKQFFITGCFIFLCLLLGGCGQSTPKIIIGPEVKAGRYVGSDFEKLYLEADEIDAIALTVVATDLTVEQALDLRYAHEVDQKEYRQTLIKNYDEDTIYSLSCNITINGNEWNVKLYDSGNSVEGPYTYHADEIYYGFDKIRMVASWVDPNDGYREYSHDYELYFTQDNENSPYLSIRMYEEIVVEKTESSLQTEYVEIYSFHLQLV